MGETQILLVEYGLGLTKSYDWNNIKPSLSVRVPVQISGTQATLQAELRHAIDMVKTAVDAVIHETLDCESELFLDNDPVYSEGPFMTLFHFQNPDTFYVVGDPQNIPPKWLQYIPHGFNRLRPEFLAHRARTRFPNEEVLHTVHGLIRLEMSCSELPTIEHFAYVVIEDTCVVFSGDALPVRVTDNPEASHEESVPQIFQNRPPKVVQGPQDYVREHIASLAGDNHIFWCSSKDDYKKLWARFGDLEQNNTAVFNDDPYDDYHDDDDDDELGW